MFSVQVNLAFILICIVFVFILSNIPRVFLNCYEFFMSEDMLRLVLLFSNQTSKGSLKTRNCFHKLV